jgi:hypothetical protein
MGNSLDDRFGHAVETLTPGYFALVMASGIVSIGMHLEGLGTLSDVLLGVCVAAFFVLLLLNGWRLLHYRKALVADFMAPDRAFRLLHLRGRHQRPRCAARCVRPLHRYGGASRPVGHRVAGAGVRRALDRGAEPG